MGSGCAFSIIESRLHPTILELWYLHRYIKLFPCNFCLTSEFFHITSVLRSPLIDPPSSLVSSISFFFLKVLLQNGSPGTFWKEMKGSSWEQINDPRGIAESKRESEAFGLKWAFQAMQ